MTGTEVKESAAATGDQLIRVATWYYVHGWSQVRIARHLGLAPSTVSRYLTRARAKGIVQVAIARPARERIDLAGILAREYGLARALVVEGTGDPLGQVAAAAASHTERHLAMNSRLGLSWGRTVASVIRHLSPGSVGGLIVSQLAGGVDATSSDIQGHDIVRATVALYPGSQPRYVHAPAVVDSERLAKALMRQRGIQRTFSDAAASQIAVVGIGDMERVATLVTCGHITQSDHEGLLKAGAVGSLNTRYFDALGGPAGDLDGRTIALSWEQLAAIPLVIAVAAGEPKAAAVAGALRSGVIDVLVVDDALAGCLVGQGGSPPIDDVE